jgi:hypothetical protein
MEQQRICLRGGSGDVCGNCRKRAGMRSRQHLLMEAADRLGRGKGSACAEDLQIVHQKVPVG